MIYGEIRLERTPLQAGQTVAVGQGIDLAAGGAHGAVPGGAGDIAGDVVGGEQAVNGDVVHHLRGAEHRGDALYLTAVILHAFHCTADALAGVDGGNQNQNILPGDHGSQVLPEDQLAVGVILRGDDVDVFGAVDGKPVIFAEMTGQEGSQNLAAVQTDNGVHALVIGIALRQGHGGLPGHGVLMLHAGNVNVMRVVGMTGGEVTGENRHLQLGIQLGSDIHNVASCSSIMPRVPANIICFLVQKSKKNSRP